MIKFCKNHISGLLLATILLLALWFRIWNVGQNPPALNWDEVSQGYNAYSMLTTGKDEWGVSFPLILRAYGDYKLPLYSYLTTASIFIFGLNAFSVRLVSALSGVMLAFLAYLITRRITRHKWWPLLAALLTALSPWSLFLSRIAVEANLGAVLFSVGIYFLIVWLDDLRSRDLVFSAMFWGLSLHAYNSARILVPPLALLTFILVIRKKLFKQLAFYLLVLFAFSIPVIVQFLDRSGSARFNWVSLIDQGTVNQIIERRVNSKLPGLVSKVLFNRPTFFVLEAGKNYLSNLSPQYLFFRGGSHYQFSQPGHELLFLVTAPFLLLGLVVFLFRNKAKERLIALWFLAAFLPSAITKDAPHVLRTALVLPAPMILSAFGLGWIISKIDRKSLFRGYLLVWVMIFAASVSFYKWWNDYQNVYPKAYSWAWQYGYKEVVGFVKENYTRYDKIIITKRYGEPHEFILFWWPWDPQKFRFDPNLVRYFRTDWYWVDAFDKFEFVNDWEMIEKSKIKNQKSKILLVTSPGNYPENWKLIKTINFLGGKPAFEVLEE